MQTQIKPEDVKHVEADVDESYDTSNPQEVNKQRKKSARTRADRLEFVKAAMGLEQGRAWFYDLLNFCKVVATPYTNDPYDTAFRCGMQNIGLMVLSDIQQAAPEQYIQMISENKSRKNG